MIDGCARHREITRPDFTIQVYPFKNMVIGARDYDVTRCARVDRYRNAELGPLGKEGRVGRRDREAGSGRIGGPGAASDRVPPIEDIPGPDERARARERY